MAQTNDSKLLEKVLSKATEDYSQDDAIMTLSTNNEMGITDFDSYKTGYLSGARRMQKEARLAALDDCKTLIKASQDFYDAWKGLEIRNFEAELKGVKRLNSAETGLNEALAAYREPKGEPKP